MEQATHRKDELAGKLQNLYPEINAYGIDLGVRIAQLIRNFAGA